MSLLKDKFMRDSGGKTNRTPLTRPCQPSQTQLLGPTAVFWTLTIPRGLPDMSHGGTWKGRPALCLSQGLKNELQGRLAPHANILQLCEQS